MSNMPRYRPMKREEHTKINFHWYLLMRSNWLAHEWSSNGWWTVKKTTKCWWRNAHGSLHMQKPLRLIFRQCFFYIRPWMWRGRFWAPALHTPQLRVIHKPTVSNIYRFRAKTSAQIRIPFSVLGKVPRIPFVRHTGFIDADFLFPENRQNGGKKMWKIFLSLEWKA